MPHEAVRAMGFATSFAPHTAGAYLPCTRSKYKSGIEAENQVGDALNVE